MRQTDFYEGKSRNQSQDWSRGTSVQTGKGPRKRLEVGAKKNEKSIEKEEEIIEGDDRVEKLRSERMVENPEERIRKEREKKIGKEGKQPLAKRLQNYVWKIR